jgi:hypothetical protein
MKVDKRKYNQPKYQMKGKRIKPKILMKDKKNDLPMIIMECQWRYHKSTLTNSLMQKIQSSMF